MHRMLVAAIITAVVPVAAVMPSAAQEPLNTQIEVSYVPPKNPAMQGVYERLKNRKVLEEVAQFLAPLRLPIKLPIKTVQCDTPNSWYESKAAGVSICYEFVDWMERLAPVDQLANGVTRQDAIVGPFVQVTFHELGHAVFDILNVPVFGREEDAADQIAGFIMLQFGKEVARRTLPGTAYFWAASSEDWDHSTYANEHGHPLQRSYNYLCMAYGGDPVAFKDLVDSNLLPKSRAEQCGHEYQQIARAFTQTIGPYIDPVLLKKVQSMQWLRPDDGK